MSKPKPRSPEIDENEMLATTYIIQNKKDYPRYVTFHFEGYIKSKDTIVFNELSKKG